jgi:hypothetical protein
VCYLVLYSFTFFLFQPGLPVLEAEINMAAPSLITPLPVENLSAIEGQKHRTFQSGIPEINTNRSRYLLTGSNNTIDASKENAFFKS